MPEITDEEYAQFQAAKQAPQSATTGHPGFWEIRLSHPREGRKRVFRTVSESRARRFITNRYPRGSEAYLVSPDGVMESYEQERQGDFGADVDQWQPFNPDDYIPPEEAVPPGESAWADVEG